jgi:branched-chain amino acid transport system substrate-binding protein
MTFKPRALSRRKFLGVAASPLLAPAITRVAAGQTSPATKTATTVKLMSIQPLTGPSASYGMRVHAGSELAVKEINAAGGFQDDRGNRYTIELGKGDMANDRNEAIALLRQAAGDPNILAVMGPCNSMGFLPMVPVAGQVKMPIIGNGSGPPIKEWNTYVVRVNPAIGVAMPIFVEAMVKKLGTKRIAFIHDQTQDGQVASYNAAKRTVQKLGVQIVADTVFRSGEQDYSAQISTIRAGGPELIGIMAAIGDGARVALQMVDMGIKAPLFTPDGAFLDTTAWDNARGAFRGGFTWIAADLVTATGGLRKFLEDYAKAYPELSPTQYSTYGYDSVYTVVEAVKKSGTATDRGKFAQALTKLDFTTPLGNRVSFKNPPTGDNLNPVVTTIRITDRGKYERMN